MDNGESMTFVLILLLLIIIVMFACHYLGPRASWICSNREEKIGLSKNKLFHTNGYMLPSGSAFLLSNSGSFKRFDITEKEDTEKSTERLSNAHNTAATPFWNIPQQEGEIPPQPLRPAPEPGKNVTFKLSAVDEICSSRGENNIGEILLPCSSSTKKIAYTHPIKIEGPPPPRMFSLMTATNGSAAIPRPMVRRNFSKENNQINKHQPLTRRNSSTNPFLCDVIDNITSEEEENQSMPNGICLDQNGDSTNKTVPAKDLNPFLDKTERIDSSSKENNFSIKNERVSPENSKILAAPSNERLFKSNTSKDSLHNTTTAPASTENRFRGRTFSETGWSPDVFLSNLKNSPYRSAVNGLKRESIINSNPFVGLAQKAKGPHMLQKTFSEDFLFRKMPNNSMNTQSNNTNGENGTWSFGRSLLRQNSLMSLGRRNSSQGSLDSNGSVEELGRAISCDSVSSDSVFLCDLDQTYTQITGHLCVGLHYDNVANEGFDLLVTIKEAKGLICPFSVESLDTFVRVYLVPDAPGAMQTQIVENSQAPYFNESFRFWLKKQNGRHSLWFHVYHNGESHTLIGEAEMEIHEAPRTITTWIPLSDSRKRNAEWGELMFSLSYLPTAERLTIVVVKARNLKLDLDPNLKSDAEPHQNGQVEIQSVFVKAYLMNNERKMQKKRTTLKRRDRSIVFNESMIFGVPPQGLTTVQLRLTVYGVVDSTTIIPLGHIIAGSCATGKGLRHWHQMLSSLRKPVSMWHVLRRATNQPVFTGGAEAVVAALQSTSLRSKRNSII